MQFNDASNLKNFQVKDRNEPRSDKNNQALCHPVLMLQELPIY